MSNSHLLLESTERLFGSRKVHLSATLFSLCSPRFSLWQKPGRTFLKETWVTIAARGLVNINASNGVFFLFSFLGIFLVGNGNANNGGGWGIHRSLWEQKHTWEYGMGNG
ncbi:hypothetical protein T440DRAFT_310187 [Plenodomus tracheiphilus IPT5]|uniref:Uncharacterized protein n=1 Tax=Plenodomus tracheiphilus IPT5 TaxID=1408161 RepID=A0A6A7BDZ0_9PLEO|nr:hypothetical protein T440DRAFT_310187 [Plenodomus tracheiphilus IPT5]